MIVDRKTIQRPLAPTASTVGPCSIIMEITGRPSSESSPAPGCNPPPPPRKKDQNIDHFKAYFSFNLTYLSERETEHLITLFKCLSNKDLMIC